MWWICIYHNKSRDMVGSDSGLGALARKNKDLDIQKKKKERLQKCELESEVMD